MNAPIRRFPIRSFAKEPRAGGRRAALLFLVLAIASPAGGAPEDLVGRASALADRSDLEGALELLDRALADAGQGEDRPVSSGDAGDRLAARALRGWVFVRLGRPERAIADYGALTRNRPEDPEGWLRLGDARLRAGDAARAEADLSRAIELASDLGQAFAHRGLARLRRGRHGEARCDLDRAIELDTGPWVYGARARCRMLAGDREGALADLRRELASTADGPCAAFWIAGFGGNVAPLAELARGEGFSCLRLRYCLGEVTEQVLLAAARATADPRARAERLCEAHGCIALLADRDGDLTRAREQYRGCLEADVPHFHESVWAEARLAELEEVAGGSER